MNKTLNIQATFIVIALLTANVNLRAQNTSYGTEAGHDGNYNSCFGYHAGDSLLGFNNTYIGYESGKSSGYAHWNTFVGSKSGTNCSTGAYNTFIGYATGENTTSGKHNTFTGNVSGLSNTTGEYNSFYGGWSGKNNATGSYNSFVGYLAGVGNTTGDYNVSLGYYSGRDNATGNYNTNLGAYAGYGNDSGSRNVFLGYKAGYLEDGSDKLYISNSADTTPLIYGDFSTDELTINGSFIVDGTASAEAIEVKLMSSNAITSDHIKTENLQVAINKVADYVFEDSYNLLSLEQVEEFVGTNKHLPGIPSGKALKNKGMNVAEMNNLLLEKIEELTLYIIEQDKKMMAQDKRISELENQK